MRVLHTGMMFLVLGGLMGCARTFRAEAVQPNPMVNAAETLRDSEQITIVTGDMELETPIGAQHTKEATPIANRRYPLLNRASFTVVSRDRLRFHVQIDHKWEEWADLNTWDVHLEDDRGNRWDPESVEHAQTRLISTFWDREQRTAICSGTGRDPMGRCFTVVGLQQDGWKHRQTMGSLSVFRGNADFVFYDRNMMHADIRKLRLVVKRTNEAFEFLWKFNDTIAAE